MNGFYSLKVKTTKWDDSIADSSFIDDITLSCGAHRSLAFTSSDGSISRYDNFSPESCRPDAAPGFGSYTLRRD
jgi:hypothetical protein